MGIAKGWLCFYATVLTLCNLVACDLSPINDPYPKEDENANIFYNSFVSTPKTLDPARSYFADEYQFLAQTYEPPLQYHYLKRPYVLIPLTANKLPEVRYYNDTDEKVAATDDAAISYSIYTIEIKPGIYYQPHPAFARNLQGKYLYHNLQQAGIDVLHFNTIDDFETLGTRELTAEDYVYQIKRLADPKVQSPIYGLMRQYIMGLANYSEMLNARYQQVDSGEGNVEQYVDHRQYPLAGAQAIDRYRYQIKIKGKYPQFSYWLAMSFFAPMPWEAERFYSQAGMEQRNLTLDWYPVGTGAYMLTKNNPNYQIILGRNPYFHRELYPRIATANDKGNGLLQSAGLELPFIDQAVFSLEKETIPRWNKFLQGYYDSSAISSDSFDEAIRIDVNGDPLLTEAMLQRNIYLQATVEPAVVYLVFNMLDDVVGGDSDAAKKLRQAISIALNFEEYIDIFVNGRGMIAQGPIPPGIFGYEGGESGINPYIYDWHADHAERKSLAIARDLLAQAGYPNGHDKKNGRQLVLNYDAVSTGGPDEKAMFDWFRKQFASLGIQLNIMATDSNRFQEKLRSGTGQIYTLAWMADYPDPENFLFLTYGPQALVPHGGQNYANFANPKYDRLFEQISAMEDSEQRRKLIEQMLMILYDDAPIVWAYYPKVLGLSHSWVHSHKATLLINNYLKYWQVDPKIRSEYQHKWNQPIIWPIAIIIIFISLGFVLLIIRYQRRLHRPAANKDK